MGKVEAKRILQNHNTLGTNPPRPAQEPLTLHQDNGTKRLIFSLIYFTQSPSSLPQEMIGIVSIVS
jgi:hypothetical protein